MKRLYILALALLVAASFSKIQGDKWQELSLFPFSDLKMILPTYLYLITIHVAFISLSWTVYLQEEEYTQEMLMFMILVLGKLLDFMLRCSQSWFQIGAYSVSYDTFQFIIFGLIILNAKKK